MALLTRRRFLQAGGITLASTAGLGSYAFGIEPGLMLDVTNYQIRPAAWPVALKLKIAVIADIHACEPWMSAARIRHIADVANGLNPDLIVLLGDFHAGHNIVSRAVFPEQWGEALSVLKAPLGVYSVLGNHDWWHGALPSIKGDDGESVRKALRAAHFTVLENDAVRIGTGDSAFWLLGLGDQMAYRTGRHGTEGIDDLAGTIAQIKDAAPAILLAHEPMVFRRVPERIALTLCGHTHGRQVNLPYPLNKMLFEGHAADRAFYGHSQSNNRHLLISGGLGTSILPVRFRRPPEVVEIDISAPGPLSGT